MASVISRVHGKRPPAICADIIRHAALLLVPEPPLSHCWLILGPSNARFINSLTAETEVRASSRPLQARELDEVGAQARQTSRKRDH